MFFGVSLALQSSLCFTGQIFDNWQANVALVCAYFSAVFAFIIGSELLHSLTRCLVIPIAEVLPLRYATYSHEASFLGSETQVAHARFAARELVGLER